jgi:1-deoxy-D-xylulose-5-phosphate synthase
MATLLENLDSPKELRSLSLGQMKQLAEEVRELIVDTISKTGGHLASSLGAVELAIALHYVFDTPRDKVVWDVGHQAYAHKIITGRRRQFSTIRQYGGISGFCKRSESEYDAFGAGHSSTSISAALGIAAARDLAKERFHVTAVIGDGSLTAGLAFEGLNNAGAKKRRFNVVLNDNEMSISPNVGALAGYLSQVITGARYNRLKAEVEHLVRPLPLVGERFFRFGKRLDEFLKGFLTSGMLFEELGFKYVGPIDGHNLHQLIETLQNVRDNVDRPTLIHVITKKGKGYKMAEKNTVLFHGTPPFCVDTGEWEEPESKAPSYTHLFGEALVQLAEKNEKIVALTAAMCSGTGLEVFARRFPHRFFDVGIAEQHAVTFAAGLATEGYKPVIAIYSSFLQRAYDQIFHDVCLQDLPVVFALDRAGLVGDDGPTHHGNFDFAYLRHLPDIVIMAPKDENELRHMIKTAVDYPGQIAVRYPRGSGQGVPLDTELHSLEIGKAEILQEGDDVTLVAIGTMVATAQEACRLLAADGTVSVEVINARFVKPLDRELICRSAGKTGRVLTVEEHALQGGFGSAVLEMLQEEGLDSVIVRRIGLPDHYIEHGKQSLLRHKYGLDAENVRRVLLEMVSAENRAS